MQWNWRWYFVFFLFYFNGTLLWELGLYCTVPMFPSQLPGYRELKLSVLKASLLPSVVGVRQVSLCALSKCVFGLTSLIFLNCSNISTGGSNPELTATHISCRTLIKQVGHWNIYCSLIFTDIPTRIRDWEHMLWNILKFYFFFLFKLLWKIE